MEMQMSIIVNPDPHAESFTPQPIHNVTAVFDDLDDVISAVRSLKQYGFADEGTSVFIGKEGLGMRVRATLADAKLASPAGPSSGFPSVRTNALGGLAGDSCQVTNV